MLKNVLVYISGPMTAKDGFTIEENVAAGVRVYLDLLQQGIPAFCPHLSGAFPSAWTALPHGAWIAYDFAIINRCTHVLMMPRWQSSLGARLEKEYAESIQVPLFYSADELAVSVDAVDPQVGSQEGPTTRDQKAIEGTTGREDA